MDDCDLESLSAVPAKLSPKFNRSVCEYTSTVPSKVDKIRIDCLTRDSGASYQIIGSNGEKVIPLKEGLVNEIKIEVTAEDGTIKIYILNIKRLSASDALLTSLVISKGKLEPAFNFEEIEYNCVVPSNCEEIEVKATAPEKQCEILVNSHELEKPVNLNIGETCVTVSVKSVDNSNKKEYIINLVRKQLLWPVFPKDVVLLKKYECPMTLSTIHCPISILGSEPRVSMTQCCIDMLTRRSKVNPLDDTPLTDPNWRVVDYEADKTITNILCNSVYSFKGCKDEITFNKMASHAKTHEMKPPEESDTTTVTNTDWYKAEFESSAASTSTQIKHTVQVHLTKLLKTFCLKVDYIIQVRAWEKRLQHMAAGSNADQLVKEAQSHIKKYKIKLPKNPGDRVTYEDGDSPSDHLQQAAICFAAAIKAKPKDAKLHLNLASVLEEQYYLDDEWGLSKKESDDTAAGTNMEAQESSKGDDCDAICKLKGIGPNAPLSQQLKAIDEEYHHLLDIGQSSKADYVQALYAWKSKQALKEGQTAVQASDDNNPLGQASLKYLDALACDSSNYLANLNVGRMKIMQKDYQEAIVRLQQALGLKPVSMIARFWLGLALYKQNDGQGERIKESLGYLHDGLTELLSRRLQEACFEGTATELSSDDPWRISNAQLLRGVFDLATALLKHPQESMRSPREIYHFVCLQSSYALCRMYARNDIFRQLEHLVLDCHYALLELLMKERSSDHDWIAQRCHYMSAMIRSVTIPQSSELLGLQEKVCQKLVSIRPCSSHALYLLGKIQLAQYDHDSSSSSAAQFLSDCRSSFKASIALEGKPMSDVLPDDVANQKWWKDKVAAEKAKAEVAAPKKAEAAKSAGRGRGAPPSRGRGTVAPRGRGAPARGAPARGRGAPAPRGGRGKGVAAPTASSSNTKCDKPIEKSPATEPEKTADTSTLATTAAGTNAPLNRVTFHARLGYARALSRTEDGVKQAQDYYEQVIKMAPEIHDAYIELAEILVKTDPLAAVDVYCRFPKKRDSESEESFDDAYLSGEIVCILMKHEKFEDPRLCEHMIAYGRVMGIGVLEKYMSTLEAKFKTNLLKSIYAGVHKKDINDSDLQDFFKFKCWI